MSYFVVFAAAFAVSVLVTPLARRLSFRLGTVVEPGGRRKHRGLMPTLGGLPLLLAFLVGVALVYWLLPPETADDARRLRGVVLGSVIVVLGGFIDDRWELPAVPQFAIQFVGAAVAMSHIIFIELFANPLPVTAVWHTPPLSWVFELRANNEVWIWRPLALFLSLFWMMGMINTVNWLDGLDGLAAGVGTIAALLFAWHSYRLGQTAVAAFPLVLAGALLGFLIYNFAPAKIFLGTAGAYFLGYQLATLSILAPAKYSTALLVMAVPIMDVAWQIIHRLRMGKNPLRGDRGHLHFRLSDGGLPTRRIVLGYYGVSAAFGLVAVLAVGPLVKLGVLLVLGTAIFLLLARLSRHSVHHA
ncbi:MAG: MraY family glycosyltransferase [Candidatus Promineifilaceae bacterium]